MQRKIRVAVLYGGRSGEHEVSLQSGASVIRHLDKKRFDVIPVSIDKSGKWRFGDLSLLEEGKSKALPVFRNSPESTLLSQSDGKASLINVDGTKTIRDIDVVFPAVHGPLCEDGTLQGLLEIAGVAYVGSGVLGSAIGMDKEIAKRLAQGAGIPVVPYVSVRKSHFEKDPEAVVQEAKKQLPLPLFVKPANMGSSVGVHKVKSWDSLLPALRDAFLYDTKVLLEKGISAREIEVAVLESLPSGTEPLVSVPGEIVPSGSHEFYSYEAKYLDESGALLKLPAELTSTQVNEAKTLARKCFLALECNGMARVDLFLDKDKNNFYFNEVNTIPGFTSISMYPKLWEASGISYPELLDRLIALAMERHAEKNSLRTAYHPVREWYKE